MPYEITHINYDLHSGRISLVLSEQEPSMEERPNKRTFRS